MSGPVVHVYYVSLVFRTSRTPGIFQMAISSESNALRVDDLFRVLKRHSGKAIGAWLVLMVLSVLALYFLPRRYKSESMLFVRVGRESVALDPTVTTGQTMTLNESRESEMNSIIEMITSRSMMERVVDEVGPEPILNPGFWGEQEAGSGSIIGGVTGAVGKVTSLLDPTGSISAREQAVQALLRGANITNARKSNIISVYYAAKTPRQAQAITQAISEAYLDEHRRIHKTQGSYEFFLSQTTMFSGQLEAALEAYRVAKDGMQLASVDGQRRLVESHVQKLATEKLTAETALTASKAKIAALDKLIATLPEKVNMQEVQGMPNVAGDSMRQALFGLEMKQKSLLSKYTADHPELKAVSEAVEGAKKIVQTQAASRVHSTTILNPSLQKFNEARLAEQTVAASLQAQHDILTSQLKLAMKKLEESNDQEKRLKTLERKVDLAERNHHFYSDKLEQARIQQSLDEEKISNVSITQAATLVEKPISPNKALVLIAGFLCSCLCGLGIAVREETKDLKVKEQTAGATSPSAQVTTLPKVGGKEALLH